ncbi:MAG: DUF559 domain-containing protein [Chloroflexi bacterium]|nr:MAG: DUF559 domain-containing protein [Chloroflexota bacterium]
MPTIQGMSLARLAERRRTMPSEALFSHRTAAWLHGLDVPACEPIEVTLPQLSCTSHLAEVSLMRSDFTESEACEVQCLPATSTTRTIADLARRAPLVEGMVVLDMALRQRLVRLEELQRWTQEHPRHRGIGRLKRAMELADPRSESPMETRLRILLIEDGLPKPEVQMPLQDETGSLIARPDLCYPEERIVVEYDGATHRESMAADNRRQNRLIDAGYRVLRFTAGDLLHRPSSVSALVRRALSA